MPSLPFKNLICLCLFYSFFVSPLVQLSFNLKLLSSLYSPSPSDLDKDLSERNGCSYVIFYTSLFGLLCRGNSAPSLHVWVPSRVRVCWSSPVLLCTAQLSSVVPAVGHASTSHLKLRVCAAKTAHAIVFTRQDLIPLFNNIHNNINFCMLQCIVLE